MTSVITANGENLVGHRIFAPTSPAQIWPLLMQRSEPSECYPQGQLLGIPGIVVRGFIKGANWYGDIAGRVLGRDFKPGDITLRCEVLAVSPLYDINTLWPENLQVGKVWLIGDLVAIGPPGSEDEVLSVSLPIPDQK